MQAVLKSLLAMVLAAGLSTAAIALPPNGPAAGAASATPASPVAANALHAAFHHDTIPIAPDLPGLLAVFIGTDTTVAIVDALRACLSIVIQTDVSVGSFGPQA